MSDNLAILSSQTTQDTFPALIPNIPDPSPKGIPLEDIIEYRNKGLSYSEIGNLVGCSKENVRQRLDAAGYNPERLKNFQRNRADMFAHIQSQLLNSLSPEAINDMYPHQRVLCSAILYDKERLERGKSTQNVSLVEIQGSIADLQDQAAKLRQSL